MTRTGELKRIDWLVNKSRNGRLTKQEQLELGEVFLTPAKQAKKVR
ncbi:MAG TPA: hypothetical protein VFV52_16805 [Bacilli bacterium]|nr:hypothetical protein [Bacilli bacterium]